MTPPPPQLHGTRRRMEEERDAPANRAGEDRDRRSMPQIGEDLGVTSAGDEEDDSSVILSPRGTATRAEE